LSFLNRVDNKKTSTQLFIN